MAKTVKFSIYPFPKFLWNIIEHVIEYKHDSYSNDHRSFPLHPKRDSSLRIDDEKSIIDLFFYKEKLVITGEPKTQKLVQSGYLPEVKVDKVEYNLEHWVNYHQGSIEKLQMHVDRFGTSQIIFLGPHLENSRPYREHNGTYQEVSFRNPFEFGEEHLVTFTSNGHIASKTLQHDQIFDFAKKMIDCDYVNIKH